MPRGVIPVGRAEHSALGSLLCADWCGADAKGGSWWHWCGLSLLKKSTSFCGLFHANLQTTGSKAVAAAKY